MRIKKDEVITLAAVSALIKILLYALPKHRPFDTGSMILLVGMHKYFVGVTTKGGI